jgi:hypothetical protein
MNSELDKIYKLNKSQMFYKLVLIASDGLQDASAADLSKYTFTLNSNSLPYKGLCFVEVEQIVLDQYQGLPAAGQVFVRVDTSQPYSGASDRLMNNNNIIAIIPIDGVNPTTYNYEPSYSTSVFTLNDNITISLTDKNGGNIASNTFTDVMVVLRIYPFRA